MGMWHLLAPSSRGSAAVAPGSAAMDGSFPCPRLPVSGAGSISPPGRFPHALGVARLEPQVESCDGISNRNSTCGPLPQRAARPIVGLVPVEGGKTFRKAPSGRSPGLAGRRRGARPRDNGLMPEVVNWPARTVALVVGVFTFWHPPYSWPPPSEFVVAVKTAAFTVASVLMLLWALADRSAPARTRYAFLRPYLLGAITVICGVVSVTPGSGSARSGAPVTLVSVCGWAAGAIRGWRLRAGAGR